MSDQPNQIEVKHAISEALRDDDAQAARENVCHVASGTLTKCGRALWVGGWMLKSPQLEGLAILTEMAAELGSGAVDLFAAEKWYAGSSLVRQLVETEYLMWQFARDPESSKWWLEASPEDVRREFAPQRMRNKSGGLFRNDEYWTHCSLGGHPNPRGRILLDAHSDPFENKRFVWADLAQHLESVWHWFQAALTSCAAMNIVPSEVIDAVSESIADWHNRDPLAKRIPIDALS